MDLVLFVQHYHIQSVLTTIKT